MNVNTLKRYIPAPVRAVAKEQLRSLLNRLVPPEPAPPASRPPELELDPHIIALPDTELRTLKRTSLNRVCDIADWRAGDRLSQVMQELGEGCYIHRKAWEYGLCVMGLQQLGAVREDAVALAVGAGYERPLYWFANKVRKMVATDLYDSSHDEGKPDMLTQPERFAPFEYRRDHLEVRRMDGTRLEFPDNSFDLVFTLSSIEHFGPRENSIRSLAEMARVLKPGGVACIATELILNRARHAEYFTYEELDSIFLKGPLKLVGGDLDLRISRSLVENPIRLDKEPDHHVSPHIVLMWGDVMFTSVMLFLQKP